MKKSGGNWKKITKYLLVILVAFAAIFGLTKSKSIMTQMKRFFAAGDVPAHEKTRTDNKVGEQKDPLSPPPGPIPRRTGGGEAREPGAGRGEAPEAGQQARFKVTVITGDSTVMSLWM